MEDLRPSRVAAETSRARRRSSLLERPDRVAFWAFALSLVALLAAVASAQAGSSGGTSGGGTSTTGGGGGSCPDSQFGRRTLKLGDCGDDVATLNWLLQSKKLAAPLDADFKPPTATAVKHFQGDAGLATSGVVRDSTATALVRTMPSQVATWYGPGFFGDETACGKTLTKRTMGVAHRALPCGAKVVLRYKGRYVRTRVIDRGPFSNGAKWDLTQATAKALRFETTDSIRVAKLSR